MTNTAKRISYTAAGALVFLLLAVVTVLVVAQTEWFRNYVKQKIIAAAEDGTGGKAEIGSFNFEASRLRATITDVVIHGKEPAGENPFLSAALVEVDLRLFTSFRHLWNVTYLGLEKPRANIVLLPDGTTNIPSPKTKSAPSDTTALETVVDLAVGHFKLSDGLVTVNASRQEVNVRGNNLRAELRFQPLTAVYSGQLAMDPIYVVSGRNTPVTFRLTIPLKLERDRLALDGATISTPASKIVIYASLSNLRKPSIAAHIQGNVALADLKNAGNLPLASSRGTPQGLSVDANLTGNDEAIQVTGLRVSLGGSSLEASGPLKGKENASLQFKTVLALGELGRLANVAAKPEGTLELNGNAKLDGMNRYLVTGNVQTKNLSFAQGSQRMSGVSFSSALRMDPNRANLQDLRFTALGGEFLGSVSLEEFSRYRVQGNLRNLDIQTAARAFGQKQLAYSGVVSGPLEASGNLKAANTKDISANARLDIAGGRRGIPLSGKLSVHYDGAADNVTVQNSYLALPHTRLNLSGSSATRLNLSLTTRDLTDLFAAAALKGAPPVKLEGGEASFTGSVVGGLVNPKIAGRLEMTKFSIEGRAFNSVSVDIGASKSAASVRDGGLTRGLMQAQFSATAGLHNWSPLPRDPLKADVSLRNGDLADIVVLAGQPPAGYSGALTASAHVEGSVANPRGSANVQATNGTISGESFDRASVQVNLSDQLVTVPAAYITSGAARVDLSAEFQHPADSFNTGHLHGHIKSNKVELAQIRSLQKQLPGSGGNVQLDADVTGDLKSGNEFLVTGVTADATAQALMSIGLSYGSLTASARTSGQTVSYKVTSDFAGSNVKVAGRTDLTKDYPTTADIDLAHLPIERILALAKQTSIPAKGNLSGTAHFAGTLSNPEGSANLQLANGAVYGEPIDRIGARVQYLARSVDLQQLQVDADGARLDLTGRFDHAVNDFQNGKLQFKVETTKIDLAKVKNAQKLRPGLGGVLQIAASGAGTLQRTEPQILLSGLNADFSAKGLSLQGNNFGDLTLKAETAGGNRTTFSLTSNLAGADIQGQGSATLAGDYPADARVTFRNVAWTRVQKLMEAAGTEPPLFEAATEGFLTVTGPLLKTSQLRGELQLAKVNVDTLARPGVTRTVGLKNEGPIDLTLDNGTIKIAGAHLTGPQTDIQTSGTVSLTAQTLNVNVNATANLSLLQSLDRDIVSSGAITGNAAIRGTFTNPLLNGQLQLNNASFNYTTLPNGISNANGTVVFNGSNATIRNLEAETGGGTLTGSGFVAFRNGLRFGLRSKASNVRVRVQQGVSAVADADIRLTGTTNASLISGTIDVQQINYAPRSDIGAILSRSATPVQSAAAPSPLLDNMKLDMRVRTSPTVGVQASLAQNLQLSADLRVRGTASQPGVLGRVDISEGELVFFGSTYTVNTGNIGFYNPVKIEPVLNISLETQAKGVDVVLTVTGPIDNMKLSYTSDPPLQFQEIVGLLASGKTPTSDPTLLANEPSQPSQSYQQMGESAIVSKALADPISSRLQRVFGVTQLKIDPAFTSGSQLPTARLTFQQQITSNVTFTYTSALDDPNSTIVRAEWSFNPQYSAVATRDQNGLISVLLFYKKQFR